MYCRSSARRSGRDRSGQPAPRSVPDPAARRRIRPRRNVLRVRGIGPPRRRGYVASKRTAEELSGCGERGRGTQAVTLSAARANAGGHVLATLRCASIVTTCGKRSPSTVPLSRLLCSIPSSRNRAKSFARHLTVEAGDDMNKRLDLAFTIACGRSPVADEARVRAIFDCPARDLCERERPRHGPGPICARCFWPEMRSSTSSEVAVAVFDMNPTRRAFLGQSRRPRIAGFGAPRGRSRGDHSRPRWHPNLHITPARRRPSSACFSTVARPDGPVRPEAGTHAERQRSPGQARSSFTRSKGSYSRRHSSSPGPGRPASSCRNSCHTRPGSSTKSRSYAR